LLEDHFQIKYGLRTMNEQDRPLHLRMIGDEFSRRKSKNPRYSLRAFSRFLQIAPTPLSEILAGKRDISLKIANRIVGAMKLEHTEKNLFLRSVAESKQNRGMRRIDHRLKEILSNKSSSYADRRPIDFDEFQVVSEWYHLAIIEMTRLDDFKLDHEWISNRLGIPAPVAWDALQRLVRLGLLVQENGTVTTNALHYETADKKRTSLAHRNHQRQLLEKSIECLETVPFDRRIHSSICFAIDPSRVPEAKQLCEEFLDRMSDLLEKNTAKIEVYQFQVSLFPMTSRKYDSKHP